MCKKLRFRRHALVDLTNVLNRINTPKFVKIYVRFYIVYIGVKSTETISIVTSQISLRFYVSKRYSIFHEIHVGSFEP